MFIGKVGQRVFIQTLIDRTIDLLTHVSCQALSTPAAGGGELFYALLFEARPQFGFAAALLSITLVAVSQFAAKGAVVLAVARGQKVGDTHVYPDHRGSGLGMDLYPLIVGEREPPALPAFVERHTAVERLVLQGFTVVVCQLHRDQQLLTKVQRADPEPVVKAGIL